MSEVDSFQVRVKNAVKGNYQSCMWRSLQYIALYEADRCLVQRYPQLKPFQKKLALLATAVDLLETLDFLDDDQRQEIMWCTKASKEPLTPGAAWRRMNFISAEISKIILPKGKELIENDDNIGKRHEEICELLLQSMYEEESNGQFKTKHHPSMWEYRCKRMFIVYRVYFRGIAVDPSIFPATPPRVVDVPTEKPPNFHQGPLKVVGVEDSLLNRASLFDESVVLTEEQKQHFISEGYLQVKQAVPAKLVHAALGAINAALCKPGSNIVIDDDGSSTQYCPGVGNSDAVLNLLKHSKAWTLAQRLLGKGNVLDARKGQVALSPPNTAKLAAGGPEEDGGIASTPKRWHFDGMERREKMYSPFSLLVGITLSDVVRPNCGNFCVFPKTHTKLLPLLKEQFESGSLSFKDENCTDKPIFYNGVQILAEAGDAIFLHQKTAHRRGPNASHLIRYQVYFRLHHKDHARNIENGCLLDHLFVEFEGLLKE